MYYHINFRSITSNVNVRISIIAPFAKILILFLLLNSFFLPPPTIIFPVSSHFLVTTICLQISLWFYSLFALVIYISHISEAIWEISGLFS